jgi:precorrin-6B methylase 1
MKRGSLTIVGTGITLLGQTTPEARAHIEQAEKILFLVADPITAYWIKRRNRSAESLHVFYKPGKDRLVAYLEMAERILSFVRKGLNVCAVFYGHPGVFVLPSHEAIRRARLEGFPAQMLPGISAEDCLFADLGIDPAESGCQNFEATDFLVYNRKFDPCCSLVLWQIGAIGHLDYKTRFNLAGVQVLVQVLRKHYHPQHQTIIYEAAQYPVCDPIIHRVPLMKIPKARITPLSTLYVPPRSQRAPDLAMLKRLGVRANTAAPDSAQTTADIIPQTV